MERKTKGLRCPFEDFTSCVACSNIIDRTAMNHTRLVAGALQNNNLFRIGKHSNVSVVRYDI